MIKGKEHNHTTIENHKKKSQKALQKCQTTISTMAICAYLSITLNVNGLTSPVRRHRMVLNEYKKDPSIWGLWDSLHM